MPAHLRPFPKSKCKLCDRAATVQLYNSWNAHCGNYCARHGRQALASQVEHENRLSIGRPPGS